MFGGSGEDQAKGELVTGKLSFADKLDLFGRLYHGVYGEKRSKTASVRALCSTLDRVRSERNAMQHSLWLAADPESFTTVNVKLSRKGSTRRISQLTEDSVREHVRSIMAARRALLKFLDEQMATCGQGKRSPARFKSA